MDFRFVFVLGLSVLSFLGSKNSTVGMIKEIGINSRYYPKWYIAPKRWMKKLFKIKQTVIPKYYYLKFFIAIIYAVIQPINLFIYFFVEIFNIGDIRICGMLIIFHSCLIIVDTICFAIMSTILKKQ